MKAKSAGFTLIELLVTVFLLAVLLSLGTPSFRDFIRNARMTAAANDLVTATNLARSESIKRNRPVSICSRKAADDECDGGDFSDGWLVFMDLDSDGDVDVDDEILDRRDGIPPSISLVTITTPTIDPDDEDSTIWEAADVSELIYGPNGFRLAAGGALPVAVAIAFCDDRGNTTTSSSDDLDISAARAIDVSILGRTQVLRDVTAIGTREGCAQ
jgi:prepilin-type N-terminal cleavage/methylation domain-containing protein